MGSGGSPVLVCAWLAASLLWGAIICAMSRPGARTGRQREGWTSYWLAWVIMAVGPFLTAPLFGAAPLPILPLQLDAALALADWTTPLQRGDIAHPGVDVIATGLVALFCAGVARGAWRLAASLQRVFGLVRAAYRLPVGYLGLSDRIPILVSETDVSAFCIGGARPAVVLSRPMLGRMSPDQVRMVVEHEVAHVRRRDPFLFVVLELVDVVFWFNPFVRRLTDQARIAAEISCDTIALEPAGAGRKAYASALLCALEGDDATAMNPVPTFGRRVEMSRVRLSHILAGGGSQHGQRASAVIVAAAIAVGLCGAAIAASTARLARFGDPTLISALEARVAALYGATRCGTEAAAGDLQGKL